MFLHYHQIIQNVNFRSFSLKLEFGIILPESPGIQNFFAFFDNLLAVVLSQQPNVCLTHRSSQNRCQPLICIFLAHVASLIKLIEIMMCFITQSTELLVGHGAHGDLRSRMYPYIGVAGREPAADI